MRRHQSGRARREQQIFINNQGTSFTQLQDSGISTGVGERCSERIDYDKDGWDDLVTGAITGFAYRLNQHGSFGPQVAIGVAGPGGEGRSVAVGDADNDGDLDV